MKLAWFGVEEWLNPMDSLARINLGSSCVSALRMDELFDLTGEDLDAFTERVYGAIRDIAEEENGESVLIVTHGTVIRRFLYKLGQTAAEGIGDAFIGNCGIVKLGYENGSFVIEEIINPNKE